MFEESRAESIIRWHLYRKWKSNRKASRLAEYNFHKVMSRLPKGVFIDLGANIGDVTSAALRYRHKVIAFEPDPTALIQLRKRFDGNENVKIIPKAIGGMARVRTH